MKIKFLGSIERNFALDWKILEGYNLNTGTLQCPMGLELQLDLLLNLRFILPHFCHIFLGF
jgi:hypothetical protein